MFQFSMFSSKLKDVINMHIAYFLISSYVDDFMLMAMFFRLLAYIYIYIYIRISLACFLVICIHSKVK